MILISPYSRKFTDHENAKNYPYWDEVTEKLTHLDELCQLGTEGEPRLRNVAQHYKNLHLKDVEHLILDCVTWVSVDTFLQHAANLMGKPGVVIFGKSDPNIFGYSQNINLLKDRSYLRSNQFSFWKDEPYNPDAFVSPDQIVKAVTKMYQQQRNEYTDTHETISALMVTKDRLQYAKESISMYQTQTYPQRELIIVDNSKDINTRKTLQSYVRQLNDSSIKYYESSLSPLGKLRNFSVRKATGTYIMAWDDDDIHSPNRMTAQYRKLQESDAQMCFVGQFQLLEVSTKKLTTITKPLEHSMLIRRSMIPMYCESLNSMEDTCLIYYSMLRNCKPTRVMDPSLYTYRSHGGNVSSPTHFQELLSLKTSSQTQ